MLEFFRMCNMNLQYMGLDWFWVMHHFVLIVETYLRRKWGNVRFIRKAEKLKTQKPQNS